MFIKNRGWCNIWRMFDIWSCRANFLPWSFSCADNSGSFRCICVTCERKGQSNEASQRSHTCKRILWLHIYRLSPNSRYAHNKCTCGGWFCTYPSSMRVSFTWGTGWASQYYQQSKSFFQSWPWYRGHFVYNVRWKIQDNRSDNKRGQKAFCKGSLWNYHTEKRCLVGSPELWWAGYLLWQEGKRLKGIWKSCKRNS